MRVQLYQDQANLEQILAIAERTLRKSVSIASLHDAANIYNALEPYAYVEKLLPVLSNERRLQQRFMQAYNLSRQIVADGYPRLTRELQRAPTIVQRHVYAAHEAMESPPPSFATPQAIQSYRRELQEIFTAEHVVSDGTLEQQCLRVTEILADLKRYTKSSTTASLLANSLITYIRRESANLKLTLAEHFQQALIAYPTKLHAAGKSKAETSELLHLYSEDCTTVERLLDAIVQQAKSKIQQPFTFFEKQLIIGAPSKSLCDVLANQLRDYGIVERFNHIPYLALATDRHHAAEILRQPRSFLDEGASVHEARPYRLQPTKKHQQGTLWNLDLVHAPKAWEKTRGAGATVAIIDTGVDYHHPDLQSRFGSVTGADFVGNGDPADDNGHGTHVAGTVAGSKTGVAPDASLYAVKVLNAEGSGSEVSVLRGIEWAIERGVHVINMSLGSAYASRPEAMLISLATRKGIAVVCAAGNDGDNVYNYPASHPGAISVAAVDRFSQRAAFSNYNDMVDFAAPGMEIYSTWPGGGYRVLSGTSMASPHVAGGCALLASSGVKDMEEQLSKSTKNLGRSDYYGSGLIQLAEALNGA